MLSQVLGAFAVRAFCRWKQIYLAGDVLVQLGQV